MNVTVIIPIHKFDGLDIELFNKALRSIEANRKTYTKGQIKTMFVCPKSENGFIEKQCSELSFKDYTITTSKKQTDFCSQVNLAASKVDTEYFSILEFDDEYTPKWFEMWSKYVFSREDVSIFLPINVQYNQEHTMWQYCNEIVWASAFSNELGYIDYDCLMSCSTFNLTGGIFNTSDFNKVGGYKANIEVAFNYELLLRMTNKKLKVFVVPKEGYHHLISRKGSLTDHYLTTMTKDDIQKWFETACADYIKTDAQSPE